MRLRPELRDNVQLQATLLGITALLLTILTPLNKPTIRLDQGSPLLLADFENDTGDPEIAENLKQLLRLSLSQSQLFHLYPDVKVQAALQRMRQDSNSLITADAASQICIRDGIPVFLLPRVGRLARDLIVSLRLVVINGNALKEIQADTVRAQSVGELLPAMDDLSKRIRQILGENAHSPSMSPTTVSPYATESAEALQFFAKSLTMHEIRDYDGEIAFLRQAVLSDPKFTAAQMQLADLYAKSGLPSAAAKHIELAKAHSADLPPKEQYQIRGAYYSMNQQYAEARRQYEALSAAYPDDWTAYCRLADFELQLHNFPRAVAAFQQAIKIADAGIEAYLGLCKAALMNGDGVTARRIWNQASALAPQNPEVVYTGGYIDLVENDLRSALSAFRIVQTNPAASIRSFGSLLVAQAQIYAGRLNASLATLDEAIREEEQQGYHASEIDKRLAAAQVHLLLENHERALGECDKINTMLLDPLRSAYLGMLYARMGKVPQAQQISRKLESGESPPMTRVQVQLLRGEILLALGEKDSAIGAFLQARTLPLGGVPSEPLARAYVQAGRWVEAEKEYRLICDRKAELLFPARLPWFSGTWTQALFELGKCLLTLQRNEEAQQYLRNYLWVMEGSDADLASMLQAKFLLTQRRSR
jgi:tetratricopeptide (TPR) repeat protein